MIRKRGNPDRSSGKSPKVRASAPTEFEIQAQRLRLTEDNYESSDHLRRWCEDNRHRFYVPEWLLKDGACPSIRIRRKRSLGVLSGHLVPKYLELLIRIRDRDLENFVYEVVISIQFVQGLFEHFQLKIKIHP